MLIGQLRRRLPQSRLIGIEPDASSWAVGEASHPYAEFLNADAAVAKDTLLEQFDVAFCLDVIQFLKEDELSGFFAACYAMLKPSGRLLLHAPTREQKRHLRRFVDWKHQPQGVRPDRVTALLDAAGFEGITVRGRTGRCASFAWELNMVLAGTPIQAVCFPILLVLAIVGELLPSSAYNTYVCEARRPG